MNIDIICTRGIELQVHIKFPLRIEGGSRRCSYKKSRVGCSRIRLKLAIGDNPISRYIRSPGGARSVVSIAKIIAELPPTNGCGKKYEPNQSEDPFHLVKNKYFCCLKFIRK